MKHTYFACLFALLSLSATVHCMKRNRIKTIAKVSLNDTNPFTSLPDDIHLFLFNHTVPIQNWQENYRNLNVIAKTAHALQQTCTAFNLSFSVERIAPLMKINNLNKNILLMSAAQEVIPGLVQYAINKKADLDHSSKTDGRTPLSTTTQENHYKCCLYLLNAGADVNKPLESNKPLAYRPIEIATRNSFFKITELLLNFKAIINEECYFCHKLPLEHILADRWRSTAQLAPIIKLLIDNGAIIPNTYKEKAKAILATLG